MNQQRQTQRGTGESGAQTAQLQQTLMENGRKAMRQFFGLPIQQTLQFQRSAAELLMNGMEAQRWAQDRGVKLTRETMDNYLQTLDSVAQNGRGHPVDTDEGDARTVVPCELVEQTHGRETSPSV